MTRIFLRGKGMVHQVGDLLDIMHDVFTSTRLDNLERFRQMVMEEKARLEQRLVPAGHQVVDLRIRSCFNESDRIAEEMGGVSYLFFIRELAKQVENNWAAVLAILEDMARLLIQRQTMLINVTAAGADWGKIEPEIHRFIAHMPEPGEPRKIWRYRKHHGNEGLVVPSQVNYVGKGADLYSLGYRYRGSTGVITRYLRNSWLWDRVRVQGGAYGAFCTFDRLSGVLAFLSYRDPNVLKTINVFDETARFLRKEKLNREEVKKAIIGTIGDIDSYQLPDARGYTSMIRYLTGITEGQRQRIRDQVLATTAEDFQSFADVLDGVARSGRVVAMGSEKALQEAREEANLELVKVL